MTKMFETIRSYIDKTNGRTFNSLYIYYLAEVESRSVLLEMKYLRTHNRLDVLKLDSLIEKDFDRILDDYV